MVIHTAEEWERRRELITRLYSRERKTLEEVRRVLAEDGFPATARMFKQRIRAWNLDKNNKESEMKAILRITRRRKLIGKDTVCHFRGRVVNNAEINRYFSRKGVTDVDCAQVDEVAPPGIRVSTPVAGVTDVECAQVDEVAPPGIRVSTPVAGVTDVECAQVDEAAPPEIRVLTPIDKILASTLTPRLLALPDTLQPFQIVSDQTRSYIYGTYESRWQPRLPLYSSRDNCEILEWRTWLFDAMDLIEVGKGLFAFTLLNKVYDRVELVLREQHPSLLGEILEVVSTYKRPSQLKFREQLVQFLFRMASIVLGPTHPLTRLLHQLLDPLLRGALVDVAMRQALGIFHSTFGASHEQTLILHGCSACVMWETADYEKAASTYRHITSIRDQKLEKRSRLSCWADIAEAEFLRSQQRHDHAEGILAEVCQRARYIESSDHVAQIMYALRSLCEIHTARGNLGMACALQRRAVELSQKYLEIDHVTTEVAIWYQEQAESVLRGLPGDEEAVVM